MHVLETLRARGMIYGETDGLKEVLQPGVGLYVGFDPTASSLHVGNLAAIMLLVHAQRSGYTPAVLLGGATAMIGDPSGRTAERPLLEEETIRTHERHIQKQLTQFLSFEGAHAAQLYNNYDWFKEMSLLRFLRDTSKHFPVGYLLGKESSRSRMPQGLSYTEFSYQLLQAYDFYLLYRDHNVCVQMGGSDQWGNITAGIELIRRRLGREAAGLTTPLITRSDGSKFGKSEGQNIWLDASLTSPYTFYQFWYNQNDQDSLSLAKVFTLLDLDQIEALFVEQGRNPSARPLQRALSEEITTRVHGRAASEQVIAASSLLFARSVRELEETPRSAFKLLAEEIPFRQVPRSKALDLYTLLCDEGQICASRSELRRLMQSRGISVQSTLLTPETRPQDLAPAFDRYLLVRRGKKSFYLLELID